MVAPSPPSSTGTAALSRPTSRRASYASDTKVPSRSWRSALAARMGPISCARSSSEAVVLAGFLGNTRFNDIARALPGITRSLLVQRLRHLERNGVLETWPSPTGHGKEYYLTPAGRDLERVIDSLGRWAIEWLFDDVE